MSSSRKRASSNQRSIGVYWIARSSDAVLRTAMPGEDTECVARAMGVARFAAENALIPGLRNGLIMCAPCSIEGVVDRDADDGAGRPPSHRRPNGAPGGAAACVTGRAHSDSGDPGDGDIAVSAQGGRKVHPAGLVNLLSRGGDPPWRLPALHPLVGETEKRASPRGGGEKTDAGRL